MVAHALGMWKDRLAHAPTLIHFLIFCNRRSPASLPLAAQSKGRSLLERCAETAAPQ
jgi:hypothetical protein